MESDGERGGCVTVHQPDLDMLLDKKVNSDADKDIFNDIGI